jgi:uncharacterized LabA/DUF88 family protein
MKRVMTYIDGFNLFFGLRSKCWKKYYWLNLHRLSTVLLKPDQSLAGVHYFTARHLDNGRNAQDRRRQNTYLEALDTLPKFRTHLGQYLKKKEKCHKCGAQWVTYEEKMTDVNIAVQMQSDAFDDLFDIALLFSADSDLTTPVRRLRTRFPSKRIIVVFPPGRHSYELKKVATGYLTIGEDKLRASQLPDLVVKSDGFTLQRPAHWR